MTTEHDATRFVLPRKDFEPAYLALHRRGELQPRAEKALAMLAECRLCPRKCYARRLNDRLGTCKTGRYARISNYFPHLGEEDPLRGSRGSGTIFFTQCNLRCVFCQNYDISHEDCGEEVGPARLAEMMLELQALGVHNINFVTPSHVVAQILEALPLAVEAGLRLPLVYNTSAYDSIEALQLLDGVIDIYMPDFKLWDQRNTFQYLVAKDYGAAARKAFAEMQRQVGPLVVDEQGLALRGLLVRHLVMPGRVAGTPQIMRFLGQLSTDTYVNIMAQYRPAGKVGAEKYTEINRPITAEEYQAAVAAAEKAGLWRFDKA